MGVYRGCSCYLMFIHLLSILTQLIVVNNNIILKKNSTKLRTTSAHLNYFNHKHNNLRIRLEEERSNKFTVYVHMHQSNLTYKL